MNGMLPPIRFNASSEMAEPLPEPISELFKDHHPNVVTLKSGYKVGALSNEVGDCHQPKDGDDGHDSSVEEEHKRPPAPLLRPASEGREGRVAVGPGNKAVADEGQHESSHCNLQGTPQTEEDAALHC